MSLGKGGAPLGASPAPGDTGFEVAHATSSHHWKRKGRITDFGDAPLLVLARRRGAVRAGWWFSGWGRKKPVRNLDSPTGLDAQFVHLGVQGASANAEQACSR